MATLLAITVGCSPPHVGTVPDGVTADLSAPDGDIGGAGTTPPSGVAGSAATPGAPTTVPSGVAGTTPSGVPAAVTPTTSTAAPRATPPASTPSPTTPPATQPAVTQPPVTQPPAPAPPPTGCGEASCAPRAELPGWRFAFADDFTTDIAAGRFPARFPGAAGGWGAYGEGWSDTSGRGRYSPSSIYASDGSLRLPLRTVNGTPRVAAVAPRVPGAPGPAGGQLYGRFAVRLRASSPAPGYKFVSLLWPDSEVWPRDGEIDFPEAELNGPVAAFTHFQGATRGNDQDAFVTGHRLTDWHTYVIEWTPSSVSYFVDGVQIGRSTTRIPNTLMHWVLQAETSLTQAAPPAGAQAEVQIDWVAVWLRG